MTHYDTLGVKPDATPDEIRQAFRRAASAAHPDKGGSSEQMQVVNLANDVLRDPERRERYDRTGLDGEPTSVEQAAQKMLSEIFEAAIEASTGHAEADVLGFARHKLSEHRKSLAGLKAQATARRGALVKRSGIVKFKGTGPNMVQKIIDRQLLAVDTSLAQLAEAQRVNELATEALTAYEGGEVAPVPQVYDPMVDAMRMMQGQSSQFNRGGGNWNTSL